MSSSDPDDVLLLQLLTRVVPEIPLESLDEWLAETEAIFGFPWDSHGQCICDSVGCYEQCTSKSTEVQEGLRRMSITDEPILNSSYNSSSLGPSRDTISCKMKKISSPA